MSGLLVQAQHFQLLVGKIQDGAARRLVHTAAFHAHKTVFHNVEDADAVRAAHSFQLFQQCAGLHGLAVPVSYTHLSGHNPVVVLSIVFYLDIPLS